MRKYFLLSAVALLATTTANATTDYAEVTAKATIEVVREVTCGDLNFGTIVVKQNNEASTITLGVNSPTINGNGIISSTTQYAPFCDLNLAMNANMPDSVTLTNENGETMTVNNIGVTNDEQIAATLNIPSNVSAGTYTGSFTLVYTE